MSYDLGKVLRYGHSIGAQVAIIFNGSLRNYYKREGYSVYTYTDHQNGRPLRWENAYEGSYERIVGFYRNLGHVVEVIEIPAEIEHQEDESTDE